MVKILNFIKNYPSVMGVLVGLVLLAGIAIRHYDNVLRQQGASAQREVVAESSRNLTERARNQDDVALSNLASLKHSIDPLSISNLVLDYSTTIVPENKANCHDPKRKGISPDRIDRLYDGLCSTYNACTDSDIASAKSTIGSVSGTESTK